MIYFDHNATSPMLPLARQAWLEATERYLGNPSSPHRLGGRGEAALTAAREQLARYLGCEPGDVVWTSGATESANTVLQHYARRRGPRREVWVSAIEHPAVLAPLGRYFPRAHRLMPVTRAGVLDLDWLHDHLRRARPRLIGLMAANNETGVIQPWAVVRALAREHGVPFFCDATQWVGRLPASGLGECDWVGGSAHKFGGPRGVGFLKCPADTRLEALLVGGPQEEGRRAGTENVPGIVAMMAALERRETALASPDEPGTPGSTPVGLRLAWRERFEEELRQRLPGTVILGAGPTRLWNTVSACLPAADCRQRWVVKLDKLGFAVSTGSACASGREAPSQVVAAMGYAATEASRVLRFSSGWETTPEEWKALLAALARVYREFGVAPSRR